MKTSILLIAFTLTCVSSGLSQAKPSSTPPAGFTEKVETPKPAVPATDSNMARAIAAIEELEREIASLKAANHDLVDRYNRLLDNYSALVAQVSAYYAQEQQINAELVKLSSTPVAVPARPEMPIVPPPIHCSAFTMGENTSVNCQ